MENGMNPEKFLRWLPVVVLLTTVAGAGAVGQFQLGAIAGELKDVEADVEENAEDIDLIQQRLIERQGAVSVSVELLKAEQKRQSDTLAEQSRKIDQMLNILRNQND